MHAHARGKPERTYCCPCTPTRTHTQTEAKKTQTDRQTEHTQADNMRKNPSKSTNMKQSAEADRYEGASAADAQSRDGRSQTRCTDTDARDGHTEAENHAPVQRVHGTRAPHTPAGFTDRTF